MAKTKLTLSVEDDVVRHAKRFSRRNRVSLSRLVQSFLGSLGDASDPEPSVVGRLRGVLPATATREEYREHLVSKHG